MTCFLSSTFLIAQNGRCAGYVFSLWRQMPPREANKIANEDVGHPVEVRRDLGSSSKAQ